LVLGIWCFDLKPDFMHRFYIPPNEWNQDAPILHGAEAHHARDVLRLTAGNKVVLFNGRGRELTAEIISVDGAEVHLRKLYEATTPPLPCRITLAQAIPKGKNMDLIVQKAVEIGAAEIAPLISDRTIVHLDEETAAQKQSKWQNIAIEAAKQCGQNWLPDVRIPRKLPQFFCGVEAGVLATPKPGEGGSLADPKTLRPARPPPHQSAFDLQLIGSLQSDAQHLKKILQEHLAHHRALPKNVLMLVGPEGDFTPAELALARTHGCRPITLGPIILRVETAAIYCLSILSYELLVRDAAS
jgi:16S rRNA (uracil1498-N3)-methyltransferase